MIEDLPPDVGGRLRQFRTRGGLSQRLLSERSGVSPNAIRLIERGQSSPTVSTLHRLATALAVRVVDFLGTPDEQSVVYSPAQGRAQTRTGEALVETLASGLANQRVEPLVVTLEPGAGSGAEKIQHRGQEFVLGLEGRVDYAVGDRSYAIGPGDSLLFEASLPHAWCNPTWEQSRFLLVLEADDNVGGQILPHLEQ